MDRFIGALPATQDGDLMLCEQHGVAYQRDMRVTAQYDQDYFNKCASYEGQEIGRAINAFRVGFVNKHIGRDAGVLDIGVGSGEFIQTRAWACDGWRNTWGYDINPAAADWLKHRDLLALQFAPFNAFTMWDVIEHVPRPQVYFDRIQDGSYLFTSLPIFSDLTRIRESKHYRPGEHLYYWTEHGFVSWLGLYGFRLIDRQDFETYAGRDNILSFAFVRA